jgi:hypothetical protein
MSDAMEDLSGAGLQTFRAAVATARDLLGERLVAAFAIGSLAHGDFSPLVSDVDVMLVLDRADASGAKAVARVERALPDRLPPGTEYPTSFFYLDWDGFDSPPPTARAAAIQRLDLMVNGRLAFGDGSGLSRVAPPARAELVRETAALALENAPGVPLDDPAALVRRGVGPLTKVALFPVRALYTTHTGEVGSSADAARWYARSGRAGAPLACEAVEWRQTGIDGREDDARALLERHLEAIYAEFAEDYATLPELDGGTWPGERRR